MFDRGEDACGDCSGMGNQDARTRVEAGWIPEVSFFFFPARVRKSHSIWIPCQNSSDCPKNAPKRMDMACVMERLPSTISLIARGATPIARAIAFCEIPMGLRYSSNRISPGVMERFISISYNVTVWFINDNQQWPLQWSASESPFSTVPY